MPRQLRLPHRTATTNYDYAESGPPALLLQQPFVLRAGGRQVLRLLFHRTSQGGGPDVFCFRGRPHHQLGTRVLHDQVLIVREASHAGYAGAVHFPSSLPSEVLQSVVRVLDQQQLEDPHGRVWHAE